MKKPWTEHLSKPKARRILNDPVCLERIDHTELTASDRRGKKDDGYRISRTGQNLLGGDARTLRPNSVRPVSLAHLREHLQGLGAQVSSQLASGVQGF